MPHRLVDPVIVAAQVITSLQTIVSRSVSAVDTAVLSVTEVITDGARNIVPSNVTIKGDCRTFSSDVQALVESRMREIVKGACVAGGTTGTVAYTHEFVPLINTAHEAAIAVAAASKVAGIHAVDGNCDLIPASEDFAHLVAAVPGCFIDLGTGLPGTSLHSPTHNFNDAALPIGAAYWIELVLSQLG